MISNREKIPSMEDPSRQQEDAHRAKDVEAHEVAKKWQPFFEDDIVPSLPPDWKPPTFPTYGITSP